MLSLRASTRMLLARGGYSSMLDMGGVHAPKTSTKLDMGKNSKVQTIALDFDLITRAVDRQRANVDSQKNEIVASGTSDDRKDNIFQNSASTSSLMPNVGLVKEIANILNVSLGDDKGNIKSRKVIKDDDISLLTGKSASTTNHDDNLDLKAPTPKKVSNHDPNMDIRGKYASKLRSKVEGGLAGVELAKSRKEEALTRGDAATHLNARFIAASKTVSSSGSKWMASTGAGTLCSFLSNRSMKIVLIPTPGPSKSSDDKLKTKQGMEDLVKQLPKVKFSLLVHGLNDENNNFDTADSILNHVILKISAKPLSTLVVSDRDDVLGAARDKGMYTCRIRRKNAPRGNITASYTVEDISEVQDVVNGLNGLSFNTVFNQ
mmetsp:Transcript_14586/g.16966  ORF Transcript_14586/g.16966 Transcript_14586/m.16966 type:complete len:376 (-) Transcript_14586:2396-3523(-)